MEDEAEAEEAEKDAVGMAAQVLPYFQHRISIQKRANENHSVMI